MPVLPSTQQTPKSDNLPPSLPSMSPIFGHSPSVDAKLQGKSAIGDVIPRLVLLFKTVMSTRMKMQFITYLIKLFVESEYGLDFLHYIHSDILETVISGALTLFDNGKKNLIYMFSKIVSERKLKLDRMPFGLIDYNIRFFNAENVVKQGMEDHYAVWQETMLAHFGHKWIALNRGPMWQYDELIESVKVDEIQPAESGVELNSVVPESACNVHVASCRMPETTEDIISAALVVSGLSAEGVSSEANLATVNSTSENILAEALLLSDVSVGLSAEGVSSEANLATVNSTSENILTEALSLSDMDIWCFSSPQSQHAEINLSGDSMVSTICGIKRNNVNGHVVTPSGELPGSNAPVESDYTAQDDDPLPIITPPQAEHRKDPLDQNRGEAVSYETDTVEKELHVVSSAENSDISCLDDVNGVSVSTLWSNLSSSEVAELLECGVDPSEMEEAWCDPTERKKVPE